MPFWKGDTIMEIWGLASMPSMKGSFDGNKNDASSEDSIVDMIKDIRDF